MIATRGVEPCYPGHQVIVARARARRMPNRLHEVNEVGLRVPAITSPQRPT
jgi:hypothetical protein